MRFQSALYWKTAIVFHTSISFDFMMYYKLYAVTCLSVAEGLDLFTCTLHLLFITVLAEVCHAYSRLPQILDINLHVGCT